MKNKMTRRNFLQNTGISAVMLGVAATTGSGCSSAKAENKVIEGFDDTYTKIDPNSKWQQKYSRKIKVGISGFGLCQFGAGFGFQDHPNVEVVAVSDVIPERCDGLAKACRCDKKYPSHEKMVEDDNIEAVFIATDAPSHARLAVLSLNRGKHVASAVPAVYASVGDGHELFETVKKTGLTYMMFETSCYRDDLYAMNKLYKAGKFGKLVYSEGEYYHYMPTPLGSYKGWRIGLPPQLYPTHSNAYYCGVTGGSFTEVTCLGMPSIIDQFQPQNNVYQNPFGTEVALFRTSEGGMSRMAVSWDTPGYDGEMGRIRGQKGSFFGHFPGLTVEGKFDGLEKAEIPLKPALPPNVSTGFHGGSHGHLTNEFIMSILENRKPSVDITMALNLTVAGIVAHQSALKDGETLKIPQFKM